LTTNKIRIQLDLHQHEAQALDKLRDSLRLRSRADTVRTALAIIEWIQKESQNGRRIFAIGEDDVVPLTLPGLTISTASKPEEE
jgi:hypothetical protein